MHTIKLLLRLFAIESRDKNKNVPATLFKQRYQPTRFSNRSQNSTQLSQCVLSTRNIIFRNFVQIKSVNSFFVNM